ncbi:MAG: hypothetical protein UT66_C0008G0013 [candidate division CPR2 bacterium GW2011_GWC1_39_9]|uniref:Uncharacterized protein n=1 Tax=candidate division CPR2 bacterium GW2011_GWC2_39_10 TaxID=1618345 RepID=A0A0G0LTB1_UNCC2|nr:MAG: hypothetical protein UT18_C0003G0022 [candidate division CPR2 bacterium GW2011_GWC2_39_10]KKR35671.1 MAG: hypothetical protein UT66_C0008G0013 [candidate division CPR2 bacterium GW2011_GWC1_39_9]
MSDYKKQGGYTIIELLVVISIFAVLSAVIGSTFLASRRNEYVLEQAAQELAAEIRLVQSEAMAVKRFQKGGSTVTAKAVAMTIKTGSYDPEIYWINSTDPSNPCPTMTSNFTKVRSLALSNRANIQNIKSAGLSIPQIYMVYTSPFGKYTGIESATEPSFMDDINNSCKPTGSISKNVKITLESAGKELDIFLDNDTGSVSVGGI